MANMTTVDILQGVKDWTTRKLNNNDAKITAEKNRAEWAESTLQQKIESEEDERKQEIQNVRDDVFGLIHDYKPITIEGNVVNAPDEEDITQQSNNLLKFKDKVYNPIVFSGLGRKYLRKNVVINEDYISFDGFVMNPEADAMLEGQPDSIFWDRLRERFIAEKDGIYYLDWQGSIDYIPVNANKIYVNENIPYFWNGDDLAVDDDVIARYGNILTQEMMPNANTIYVIQYDFTLGENITVPANCVLKFDGGSISGAYTITGQNTGIDAGLVKIFNTDMTLTGTWNVAEAFPEWFGANRSSNDESVYINKAFTVSDNVSLCARTYNVGSTINIETGKGLFGKGRDLTKLFCTTNNITLITLSNSDWRPFNSLKGLSIVGTEEYKPLYAIYGNATNNAIIEDVSVSHASTAFYFSTAINNNFRNIFIDNCEKGFHIDSQSYFNKLYNFVITKVGEGLRVAGQSRLSIFSLDIEYFRNYAINLISGSVGIYGFHCEDSDPAHTTGPAFFISNHGDGMVLGGFFGPEKENCYYLKLKDETATFRGESVTIKSIIPLQLNNGRCLLFNCKMLNSNGGIQPVIATDDNLLLDLSYPKYSQSAGNYYNIRCKNISINSKKPVTISEDLTATFTEAFSVPANSTVDKFVTSTTTLSQYSNNVIAIRFPNTELPAGIVVMAWVKPSYTNKVTVRFANITGTDVSIPANTTLRLIIQ